MAQCSWREWSAWVSSRKIHETIVRKAARLIHPDSPYRKCLDMIIAMAEAGKSAQEIADAVEDRWHIEYPATNNAVPNGGLTAHWSLVRRRRSPQDLQHHFSRSRFHRYRLQCCQRCFSDRGNARNEMHS